MTPADPIPGFRILGELGRGGMGVVYDAVRETDGRPVALKTLVVGDARRRGAVRREIRSLRRLRHPGVVGILAEGVHGETPWYAMERVDGLSLQALLATARSSTGRTFVDDASDGETSASSSRVDADWAVRVVRRLAEALGWLHGEGYVHLDVKPDNVALRDDGEPVLLDLGLTVQGGRARELVDAWTFGAGSVAYMAPEQIRRGLVDPRADLYALGCVAYELLAGQPPFTGPSAVVAAGHVGRTPAPLSDHADVDSRLDEIVARMLAKAPADRPGSAEEVVAALDAVLPFWGEPWPKARPWLHRPALVGREGAIAAVEDGLQRGLVVLEAAPGLGRTRLALEILSRRVAAGARGHVVAGRPGAEPLGPLRPLLEDAVPAHDLDDAMQRTDLPLDEVRRQVFELASRRFPEDREYALVVDDAQDADEWTVGLLRHLIVARPNVRLILTSRVEDGRDRADGSPAVGALREDAVATVALAPLDATDVRALASSMLASSAPQELVRWLVTFADGSPATAVEGLRSALAGGALTREGHGWRVDAARLPADRQRAHAATLDALSPRTVERLAMIGRGGVPLDVLRAAWDADAEDELAEAVRADLAWIDGDVVQLTADGLAEACAARAGDPADLHRRLASAFGARGDTAREALHAEAAGDLDVARRAWVETARRARARHAPHLALGAWRRRLALAEPGDPDLHVVKLQVARAAGLVGSAVALPQTEEAFAACLGTDAEADAASELADHLERVGRIDDAQAVLRDAAGRLEGRARVVDALRLRALRARRAWHSRQDPSSADELADVLARARQHGDVEVEKQALLGLAMLELQLGRLEAAQARHGELLKALAKAPDRYQEACTWGNLGVVARRKGDLAEAARLHREAAERFRALGHRPAEVTAWVNLALCEAETDPDTALASYARVRALCAAVPVPRLAAMASTHEATLLRRRGDLAGAERCLDEAEPYWSRIGDPLRLAAVEVERGLLAIARGEPATAHLERAVARAGSAAAVAGSSAAEEIERLREAIAHDGERRYGEPVHRVPAALRG